MAEYDVPEAVQKKMLGEKRAALRIEPLMKVASASSYDPAILRWYETFPPPRSGGG